MANCKQGPCKFCGKASMPRKTSKAPYICRQCHNNKQKEYRSYKRYGRKHRVTFDWREAPDITYNEKQKIWAAHRETGLSVRDILVEWGL